MFDAGSLVPIAISVVAQTKKTGKDPASPTVSTERIIRYVRDKFGVSDNVVLTVDPFKSSPESGLFSSAVEVGTGKDKKTNSFVVSKDGHTIIFGNLVPLSGTPAQAIEQQVRQSSKLPANVGLTVGALKASKFPGSWRDLREKQR